MRFLYNYTFDTLYSWVSERERESFCVETGVMTTPERESRRERSISRCIARALSLSLHGARRPFYRGNYVFVSIFIFTFQFPEPNSGYPSLLFQMGSPSIHERGISFCVTGK